MSSDPAKGDELGRTTTEAPSSARARAEAPPGGCVGRYRLEREIGAGAMGVVHAAFDPDLERRIALKVLRVAAPGTEAKDRLLREARAMARLAHPNVVTVHEVGTTNGRDYIAMELIQGETLAEWLRSTRRRSVDIIAAFLAAGRGLAAAHAAGIVHRDFKPHNVLRNRDGRIVVTDFGLAREAQADLPVQLDATLPLGTQATASASTTPSSLAGITITGSLLGTPAYMAPEQWSGGTVTPATDQFAYCVALWEALAGERPYKGPTLDELRKQAALGPGALDASNIPRRVRAILRRGLDPEPARRWPNMDALLARIVRVERRAGVALVIAAGALVAAVALVLAMRAGHQLAARPDCDPPAFDPARAWSPAAHAEVGSQTAAARLLDADISAWRSVRGAACKADPGVRGLRLACLDGVLARIEAVAGAARANRDALQIDAGELLIDPSVCALARPPRLMAVASPQFREVVTRWLSLTATPLPLPAADAGALIERSAADPCASSLAHLLATNVRGISPAERGHHIDEAQQGAERCGDDRVLAETALAAERVALDNEWLGETVTTKLRLAEAAVLRVEQRDLVAQIDLMRVDIAKRADNLDEAIARGIASVNGFAARHRLRVEIDAGLTVLALRQLRATPADVEAVPGLLALWRTRAVAELGEADEIIRAIDARSAEWMFSRGDVAGAHALFDRVRRPLPNDKPRRIAGIVIDAAGQPVPGATVTAGRLMLGDSVSAVVAIRGRNSLRTTTSGPDGRFEIPDATDDAFVIAELGDRRSSPMYPDDVRLVLEPTSRLEGKVDLAGEAATNVSIVVKDLGQAMTMRYSLIAPVAADGTFSVNGVPRRDVRVFATIDGLSDSVLGGANVTVRTPTVRGLALSLARSKRTVHILVRSTVNTKVANAEVVVLAGNVPSMNLKDLNQQFRGGNIRMARQLEGEHAPKQVVTNAQPGDLFATMTAVPEGIATACAFPLPEMSNEDLQRKLHAHLDRVQVTCTPIPAGADLVAIEVPPFPRLD